MLLSSGPCFRKSPSSCPCFFPHSFCRLLLPLLPFRSPPLPSPGISFHHQPTQPQHHLLAASLTSTFGCISLPPLSLSCCEHALTQDSQTWTLQKKDNFSSQFSFKDCNFFLERGGKSDNFQIWKKVLVLVFLVSLLFFFAQLRKIGWFN